MGRWFICQSSLLRLVVVRDLYSHLNTIKIYFQVGEKVFVCSSHVFNYDFTTFIRLFLLLIMDDRLKVVWNTLHIQVSAVIMEIYVHLITLILLVLPLRAKL